MEIEQQRMLIELAKEHSPREVERLTGVSYQMVSSLSMSGVVPKKSKAWRCPGCGQKSLYVPCMACEIRSVVSG